MSLLKRNPKKKPKRIFGRHWYTSHAIMLSPDGRYELTLMWLLRRFIGAHLRDLDSSITLCLSPDDLDEYFSKEPYA